MNRLLLGLCAAAALWTAACGGGSIVTPPPPVGKYNLASLKGQYAFVSDGEVFVNGATTATPLARTGVFMADGQGGIIGGVEDTNAAGLYNPALQVSGGSYTVNADGRGTLTLNVVSNGVTSPITFGIVLTSVNDGLLIDETSNNNQASTGSGNFVKQNVASFTSPVPAISGPYVFDLSGLDASGSSESLVGEFTAAIGATSVTTTAAFEDDNDSGVLSNGAFSGTFGNDPAQPMTLASFGRGLAVLHGTNYVFYIVDGTRVRFLSALNVGNTMLSGDAVSQSGNVPTSTVNFSGSFSFILSGSSTNGGLTRVGRFAANSATVSNVLADTNDAGTQHPSKSFSSGTITFDTANPGRGHITFQDSSFPFTFVFYLSSPNSGVIQDVTETAPGSGLAIVIADGSLALQSGGPFTSSNITGTYAMNWSGLVTAGGSFAVQDEEDLLAQATVTNLGLRGTADLFQFTTGTLRTDLGVGGTININGDGTSGDGNRSGVTVNLSGASPIDLVIYFVNPQTAFFANRDNSGAPRIVAGILKLQQ
jgi:hypothetical protein